MPWTPPEKTGDSRPDAAPGARRRALLFPAAIVALGVAAYSNSLGVPFQFDDGRHIVENPAVRDVGTFLASRPAPSRAVAFFSFAVNGSLGGQAVFGYHLLNLLVHLGSALALYALALFACRAAAPPDDALARRAPLAALLAAAIFVAHPLQTQAVTYVVQRMASLAALLYLAATLAYARSALAERPARRIALYAAAVALGGLAFFTKENAITLVAALALVEALLLAGPARVRAARLAPFAVLTCVALLALKPVAVAEATGAEFVRGAAVAGAGAEVGPAWRSYALQQPLAILGYLRLLALPAGQNIDHDPPPIASAADPRVLLALAALAALLAAPAALAWRARHRSRVARVGLFGIGWFVVTMAVESSVIPIQDVMVEHRMYLPSAGLLLAAAAAAVGGLERAGPRLRRAALAGAALYVLVLAGAAWARNEVWRDPATLWGDAAAKSPRLARPWVYLGQHRIRLGDPAGAVPLFEEATRRVPRYPHAFLNLGRAYALTGRHAEAERAYREGFAMGGRKMRTAHLWFAELLLDQGRTAEACEQFRAEVAVDPRSREARTNLVGCSLMAGAPGAALAEAERLEREYPGDPRLLFNLALAADAAGEPERAAVAFSRFLRIEDPALAPQQEAARRWLAGRDRAGARPRERQGSEARDGAARGATPAP